MREREEEERRQIRIWQQQQAEQQAKHAGGADVRALPGMAGKKRLQMLRHLQHLVDQR